MVKAKSAKHIQDIFIGMHNADIERARGRLIKGNTYRDLSTVCVIPTRGLIPAKVVQSWWGMMTPMNQKFMRIFVEKMEVGEAYNAGVEAILSNPELSKWKYLLTIEEDNIIPPDGLLKLYESIDKFDVISGLYFVKGDHSAAAAMIYGDPEVYPKNYIPQVPKPECLQPCNGIGMGFALFRMDIFKKMPKPWFKTMQEYVPGEGTRASTQDLWFCSEAQKFGIKFAVDTRVRCGHYDYQNDMCW